MLLKQLWFLCAAAASAIVMVRLCHGNPPCAAGGRPQVHWHAVHRGTLFLPTVFKTLLSARKLAGILQHMTAQSEPSRAGLETLLACM